MNKIKVDMSELSYYEFLQYAPKHIVEKFKMMHRNLLTDDLFRCYTTSQWYWQEQVNSNK